MQENTRKKAGIWVRISIEPQSDDKELDERQLAEVSLEAHRKRCEDYARSKGWSIVETYSFIGSGKSVLDHPETKRMVRDVESGHIEVLVLSELSRLGRRVKELVELKELLDEHNVALVSLRESIDTTTASGRLSFNLQSSVSQFEREVIVERITAKFRSKVELGESLGGIAPYGYRWQGKKPDKTLIPNTSEAIIVKEVFDTFLQCRKYRTTAKLLNQKGYRTRKGVLWSDTSVSRMLQDSTYNGIHYMNRTQPKGENKHWTLKDRSKWKAVEVESIVDGQIWNQVQAIMRMNGSRRKRRTNVYLLSGLVYCGTCGSKMYGYDYERSKGYYRCYKCSEKIPIKDLENTLIDSLKSYKFSPSQLSGLPEASITELERKLTTSKRELTKMQTKINEVFELYYRKKISGTTFDMQVKRLEERQEQMSKAIPKLEEEIMTKKLKQQKTEITTHITSIGEILPRMNFETRRAIIEDLVVSIEVNKDNIAIGFYLLNFLKKNLTEVRKINEPSWIHGCGEHEARWIG